MKLRDVAIQLTLDEWVYATTPQFGAQIIRHEYMTYWYCGHASTPRHLPAPAGILDNVSAIPFYRAPVYDCLHKMRRTGVPVRLQRHI